MAQTQQPDSFAPWNFPTVFADNVLNIANSQTVVKFFLSRVEPSLISSGVTQTQSIAQVIMPIEGFVATFTFFEAAIKRYIEQGIIKEETLESFRAANANIQWKNP